jgi:pimeloyl-ACP methyl ester carboxylesterase
MHTLPAVLREGKFEADGAHLHYIDWGGEGRNVVLLAGIGGTAQLYRGLAPILAERFRVAALTRRGHGRSDRPESGYDSDSAVDDIRRFLDHLRIRRAVLIGHSWAGLEMTRFCGVHPDRVEAVVYLDALNVLLEPLPDGDADPVWTMVEIKPQAADLVSVDACLAFVKRSRPDLAAIWCEAIEADRRDTIGAIVRRGPDAPVYERMREGLGDHRNPKYEDIRVPSLAIVPVGKTHPFVMPGLAQEMKQAIDGFYAEHFYPWVMRRTESFLRAVPDATVVGLDTSNHTIFVAKEAETAGAILEWLETH